MQLLIIEMKNLIKILMEIKVNRNKTLNKTKFKTINTLKIKVENNLTLIKSSE